MFVWNGEDDWYLRVNCHLSDVFFKVIRLDGGVRMSPGGPTGFAPSRL